MEHGSSCRCSRSCLPFQGGLRPGLEVATSSGGMIRSNVLAVARTMTAGPHTVKVKPSVNQ
eukprot:1807265-Amphidinium_carterae.2